MKKTLLLFFLLSFLKINAQISDTLVLKNNDIIVGEIKTMNKGIVQIETDYSKEDFKVEWKHVKSIGSERIHIINLSNGSLLNGKITKIKTPNKCEITNIETQTKSIIDLSDIVRIKPVDNSFWDRLDASFDAGIKLTKSQNLQQLSINVNLGYTAKKWYGTATYKQIQSVQDDIDPIRRIDTDLSYIHLLPKDYFIPLSIVTLKNTEQDIDLRIVSKAGYGKYLIHSNKKYWGIASGLSFNHERFTEMPEPNKSLELFLGSDLNLYDIGDFSIQSKVNFFPSLTESKRIRADFSVDTKYDLPLDFFIKLSFIYNYDNKPKEGASKDDYVFQTTFGWKLD